MEAKYVRVSTYEQKPDRQTLNFKGKIFPDSCSGSVPFAERTEAKKLLKLIDNNSIKVVYVHSIDRLGRNTIDVLQTIQGLTAKGVNVISEKEGLQTLLPNGDENPTAKLIINILASVAEMERNHILERQKEGIAIKKTNGGYKGRKVGTKKKNKEILKKYKSVCKSLERQPFSKLSLRTIAELNKVSLGTVQRVKNIMKAEGVL